MLALFEGIDHRQCHDDRNTVFEKLCYKVEISLEVCRVGHGNDRIGPSDLGRLSLKHFASNRFVDGCGFKTVKPGQIDQRDRRSGRCPDARTPLDGHARIIRYFLAEAC
jgi:hypothetical protein